VTVRQPAPIHAHSDRSRSAHADRVRDRGSGLSAARRDEVEKSPLAHEFEELVEEGLRAFNVERVMWAMRRRAIAW